MALRTCTASLLLLLVLGACGGGGADRAPVSTPPNGALVAPYAAPRASPPPVGPGPACAGACAPTVLADGQHQPTVVAVDGGNVYWATEGGAPGVWQCPKTGCTGAPLLLATPVLTTGLALDASRVYFGDFSGGKLLACAIGGCANQPTVLSAAEPQIESVVSDGVSLYWATRGKVRACRLPCSGGPGDAPRTVLEQGGSFVNLTADQGKVFWADRTSGKLFTCDGAACAAPVVLGAGIDTGMSATRGHVFWAAAPSSVVVCEANGCRGMARTIGASYKPSNVVSDDLNVYWRDVTSGDILRCSALGCGSASAAYQARQQGQPGGKMALDGQYLYWATASQVLRAPK
jgi:hypothetical protein